MRAACCLAAVLLAAAAAFPAGAQEAGPADGVPFEQAGGRILAIKTLCKQPGRFIGWPSIAQAPNGDLLAVFSGDRSAHISPDGKVQMVRSADGGATWSEPMTVFDTP
ncbi:MAG TPA: sialidase family protein, partial [Candidatus Hydrogenedentes bacterium]|nr:sialidase family protein [Candidatus Hydrogenedentota bacterium]